LAGAINGTNVAGSTIYLLILWKIRGNAGDLILGSMRLVFNHVLVTESVQAVNRVEIFTEKLGVDLEVMVEQEKVASE
jgi:hypothetical protein